MVERRNTWGVARETLPPHGRHIGLHVLFQWPHHLVVTAGMFIVLAWSFLGVASRADSPVPVVGGDGAMVPQPEIQLAQAILPKSPRRRTLVNAPTGNDPQQVTDTEVLDSMKKGSDYLLNHLADGGGDKDVHSRWIGNAPGERVLMLYALLQVGVATREERLSFRSKELQDQIKWLTELQSDKTYVAALQACALACLPNKTEYHKPLTRVAAELVAGMNEGGGYTYELRTAGEGKVGHGTRMEFGVWDNSNTQYGLLGVWAAADSGVEIPNNYWRTTDAFWRKVQSRDGGWDYSQGREESTPTMSAAGVASLFVTGEFMDLEARLEPKKDDALDKGLAWLIKNYDAHADDLYYQYGIERIGLASGLRHFKGVDWYRQTAAQLLRTQNPNGSWDSNFIGATPNVSTSYALLFLMRGRSPVVFNKLQYNGPWNARPRDDANLTRWMSKKFETPLNWQIVTLQDGAAALQEVPVLLITGSKDPGFTPDEITRLQEFVNTGGLVFSSADGDSAEFTAAVRHYAALVSSDRYEMRELPADHPIFTIHEEIPNPPRLLGLSNGIRELWIHSPMDMGAAWQTHAVATREYWNIPAGVFFYATGKGTLRSKLESHALPEAAVDPVRTVSIARIQYSGNFDPEPAAWPRMAQLARTQFATDLKVTDSTVRQLDATKIRLAYMTGTTRFTLNAIDQLRLKAYLEAGGTLFVDCAGGSPAYGKSATQLFKAMYPDAHLDAIPADHPIYKGGFAGGAEIKSVEYRKCWKLQEGNSSQPRLKGLKVGTRYAVIFSQDDILSGFLGTDTWGVMGYAPASAQALARNIILFSQATKDAGKAEQ